MVNHTKSILDTITEFLGIELDSTLMQARLPIDKLVRARNTMKDLLNRVKILYRELESAIGFLSFAIKVVIPERAFLRRLFNALRRSIAIVRITSAMKVDLQ